MAAVRARVLRRAVRAAAAPTPRGLALRITATTISRNQASYNGGIWINTCQVAMTNTTIAENVAAGSNGGGRWLGHTPTGTLRNCTIGNNRATAANQIVGAIAAVFGCPGNLRSWPSSGSRTLRGTRSRYSNFAGVFTCAQAPFWK